MIPFNLIEVSVAMFLLSTLCLSAVIGWQTWRLRQVESKVLDLQQQLDLFVDASINVARVVDKAIHRQPANSTSPVNRQSSRRWILREARERIDQGEKTLDIAAPLGLSKDEVRLLNLGSSQAVDSRQHSH